MNIDLKSKSMTVETSTLVAQNDANDASVGLDSFAMALSLQQTARQQNNATLSKALASSAMLPKQSNSNQQNVRAVNDTKQSETTTGNPQTSRPRADNPHHTRTHLNREQQLSSQQQQARATQELQAKGRQENAQDATHLQQQRQLKQRQHQRLEKQRVDQQRNEQLRQHNQRHHTETSSNATSASTSSATPAYGQPLAAQKVPAEHTGSHRLNAAEKKLISSSRPLDRVTELQHFADKTPRLSQEFADETQDDNLVHREADCADNLVGELAQDTLLQGMTHGDNFDAEMAARATSNAVMVEGMDNTEATLNTVNLENTVSSVRAGYAGSLGVSDADKNKSEINSLEHKSHASKSREAAFDMPLPTIAASDNHVAQRLLNDVLMTPPSMEGDKTATAEPRTTPPLTANLTTAMGGLGGFSVEELAVERDVASTQPLLPDPATNSATMNSLGAVAVALHNNADSKNAQANLNGLSNLQAGGLNVQSIGAASTKDDGVMPPMQDFYQHGIAEFSVDAQENAALEAKAAATATTKPVPTSGAPALSNNTSTINSSSAQTLLVQQQEAAKSVTDERQIAGNTKGGAVSMSARLAQAKLQEQLQDKADDKAKDKIQQKLQDKAALVEGKLADHLAVDSAMLRHAKDVMSHDPLLASSFSNHLVATQTVTATSAALTVGQNTASSTTAGTLASLSNVTPNNNLTSAAAQTNVTPQADPSTAVVAEPVSLLQPDAGLQLAERISAQVQGKLQSVDVKLAPEQLGEMTIRIELQQEQLSVQFMVQQAQAKELLEQHLPKLKEHLEQQGMQLAHSEVTQQDQSPPQGGQQERQQSPSVANALTSEDVQSDITPVAPARKSEGRVDFYA